MAEQEIARIARAALADHGCLRAAIAHRTGVVAVGEASVGDRDLLGPPRRRVRRLQAGHRHAQGDGADLEEGALRRRRGLDRPGRALERRLRRFARATVRAVSTEHPSRSSPSRARRPSRPASTSGRSTRRARCACGRAASAARSSPRVVFGFQWLLKLKFLLFAVAKFGFVTTALTMVVSVGAYTLLWGWQFAALFVLLMFVHELGHALWMRKEGIPAGAPVFIPFLGAVISMRDRPRDAYVEAKVGLAGPVLGTHRRGRRARPRRADRLRPAAGGGLDGLPAQPLQPAADRAARRRPRHGRRSTRRCGSPASPAWRRC